MVQYLIKAREAEKKWLEDFGKSKHWKARKIKTKSKIAKRKRR